MNDLSIPNYEVSSQIKDLIIFKPNVYSDYRGDNFEIFNNEYLKIIKKEIRKDLSFPVDTASISRKNVIRAFHSDSLNYKFVQCLHGEIYAVIVSEDLKSKVCITLNDRNKIQLLIPPKAFNGYLCLSDYCTYTYKWSHAYIGIKDQITKKWDELGVYWPIKYPILSERDS